MKNQEVSRANILSTSSQVWHTWWLSEVERTHAFTCWLQVVSGQQGVHRRDDHDVHSNDDDDGRVVV